MMRDVDYDDTETWNAFLDQMTIEEMASFIPKCTGDFRDKFYCASSKHIPVTDAMDQMHHSPNY